jgi:hypothetical protein
LVNCCNPTYSGGRDRRITVQSQSGQKYETLSEKQLKKKQKSKRTGGMHKTLSSISSITKKIEKKMKRQQPAE